MDSRTRSSPEGAPLNSHPKPSGSPTPHLGGKQTPAPEESRRRPPRPSRAHCQVSRRRPHLSEAASPGPPRSRRAPLTCRDPPWPQLARAGTAGTRRGRGHLPGRPTSSAPARQPRLQGAETAARHLGATSHLSAAAAPRGSSGCCPWARAGRRGRDRS